MDKDITLEQEFDLVFKAHSRVKTSCAISSASCPERRRLIFEMSRIQGMSHLEIAEKLDISVRTVERQIYRRRSGNCSTAICRANCISL